MCDGDGSCFSQCICICDEEFECDCGHRYHKSTYAGSEFNTFCQKPCTYNCELKPCHNYRLCGQKRPAWILDCDNGMCLDCAMFLGKLTFLDVKAECPICSEEKYMVGIHCKKHNVCLDCWLDWSLETTPLTCPMCRKSIWEE